MENAVFGIIGVLIGILFNELIRRKNRIENYSQKVFEKRFEVYEKLYELVDRASSSIDNLIEDEDTPFEEKFNSAFEEGAKVLEYCTEKQFYLNEEIVVLVGSAFVGTASIFEAEEEDEIENETTRFRLDIKNAKQMIMKESGIYEINKHFKTVAKVKYKAPIIDYYRELKDKYNVNG
jgi:uncharacterized membrane protein YgaE (UPF0421/DUF939 family)